MIYNMMFPGSLDEDLPCPPCTQFLDSLFLDSFDGAAEHITQRVNLAVVAKRTCRARSCTLGSAAGAGSGSYPRLPTPSTAIITGKLPTAPRCR